MPLMVKLQVGTFSGGSVQFNGDFTNQLAYIGCTILGRSIQANYNKPLSKDTLTDFIQQLNQKA